MIQIGGKNRADFCRPQPFFVYSRSGMRGRGASISSRAGVAAGGESGGVASERPPTTTTTRRPPPRGTAAATAVEARRRPRQVAGTATGIRILPVKFFHSGSEHFSSRILHEKRNEK
jgi:hypothetical protein